MLIDGKHYRTIWEKDAKVYIIDQRSLPHELVLEEITSSSSMVTAIKEMHLRGAPLIGVAAAYGVYLAALESKNFADFELKLDALLKSRPTAINLAWAIQIQRQIIDPKRAPSENAMALKNNANKLAEEDIQFCKDIGIHGVKLIQDLHKKNSSRAVNILTHCNAGWLATIDYGTATASIYQAQAAGIPIHVWVDETRPRLQGAKLTCFELKEQGVPHTLITDNAGGQLMQNGQIDICIVGADRVARNGDAANKIGTYLKALAAKDNNVPFYFAFPKSTIDWSIGNGQRDIPIENRDQSEVLIIDGISSNDLPAHVNIAPQGTQARNPGFDVTPARLIDGFITERGICAATTEGLQSLYKEFQ